MKKVVVVACILFYSVVLKAQQAGMYTHFFYKPMIYNPAYTGEGGNINAMLINRTQWTGFSGAPQLNMFILDGKISSKKIRLGVNFVSDKQGLTSNIGGNFFYAYKLVFNENVRLSLGISLGVIDHSLNFSKALVENTSDPYLSLSNQHKTTIDGNAGVALFLRKFEFGFSMPQLIGNKIKFNTQSGSTTYFTQSPNAIGYVKYKFLISEDKGISLSPIGLIRQVSNTPLQYDGGIYLDWKNKFWLGTLYRSNYAVAVNVGFCIYKRLNIGYSYDFAIGNIAQYAGMTHEIMLSYKFGKEKNEIEIDSTKLNKLPDLNTLLLKKLLFEIDSIYENPAATAADYAALNEKVLEFSRAHFDDPKIRNALKQYTEKLAEKTTPAETNAHVLVKGRIVFSDKKAKLLGDSFSDVRITLMDKATNSDIGTYTPKARTGKYILILKPGEKYKVVVENDGYQTFSKDITPAIKKKSYEIEQVIKLKKTKAVKSKK